MLFYQWYFSFADCTVRSFFPIREFLLSLFLIYRYILQNKHTSIVFDTLQNISLGCNLQDVVFLVVSNFVVGELTKVIYFHVFL
jgi:hypothetical protein